MSPYSQLETEGRSFIIVASGCFWGTEYYFAKAAGVLSTEVGYTGGTVENPSYEAVCTGTTGHVEAVRIEYDTAQTNYEALAKLFFETHDFTQTDGQGPDRGSQYLSRLFFASESEQKIAEELCAQLRERGYAVATKVVEMAPFYAAEDYHHDYYEKRGGTPYCHRYRKIFD